MMEPRRGTSRSPGGSGASTTSTGIGLAAAGYGLFAVQDAIVKLLVVRLPVPEILFVRSLLILGIGIGVARVRGSRLGMGRRGLALAGGRAVLILVAWLSYYTAARELGLAEMTTLYFVAPIFVVLLSVTLLREAVNTARWAAVLVGFAGVLVAARPGGSIAPAPAALALVAALSWGASTILARLVTRSETTAAQIAVSNLLFAVGCAVMLPWLWTTPTLWEAALLALLGLIGGLGQALLFESFRFAPASALAPVEYTALIWAFILGYVIWSDVPQPQVVLGALLIAGASLGLLWSENRRRVR